MSRNLFATSNRPSIWLKVAALALVGAVALAWLVGPYVVELAYHRQGPGFLDSIIAGRESYSLEFYVGLLTSRLRVWSAPALLLVAPLYHLASSLERGRMSDGADVLVHLRIARRRRGALLLLYIATFLSAGYMLLSLEGSVVGIWLTDYFIFYDGAYRLSQGQIPHADFHTPLGALCYLLPYLGVQIAGTYPGSLEAMSLVVAALLFVPALHVLTTRYSLTSSLLILVLIAALIIVPLNSGERAVTYVTQAMFYNRFGWAALLVLMLFVTEPLERERWHRFADHASIVLLLLFLFFLKITFFAVGVGFLVVWAIMSGYGRGVALASVAICVLLVFAVEISFGSVGDYFADLYSTLQVRGSVGGSLVDSFARNIREFGIAGIAVGVLVAARGMDWRQGLFVLFAASAGLTILDTNAQRFWGYGVLTLVIVIAWADERLRRGAPSDGLPPGSPESDRSESGEPEPDGPESSSVRIPWRPRLLTLSLLGIMVAEPVVVRTDVMWNDYARVATREEVTDLPPALRGLRVGSRRELRTRFIEPGSPRTAPDLFSGIRGILPRDAQLTIGEYLETIRKGYRLLIEEELPPGSLVTLDFVNPFPFLLSMQPSEGDYSFYQANRVISEDHAPSAQALLGSARFVFVPRYPAVENAHQLLMSLYFPYVEENYHLRGENSFWELYEADTPRKRTRFGFGRSGSTLNR